MVSFTINGDNEEVVTARPDDMVDVPSAAVVVEPKANRVGLIGFRGFQLQSILNPQASRMHGERIHKVRHDRGLI